MAGRMDVSPVVTEEMSRLMLSQQKEGEAFNGVTIHFIPRIHTTSRRRLCQVRSE